MFMPETLMVGPWLGVDDFIWRGVLAGWLVALVAGPLGCFVVWRKMAYFGDALSHSALLGIALGLVAGMGVHPAILLVSLCFALLLSVLQRQKNLATDTLLGIVSHGALSCGMVVIGLAGASTPDLHAYLFGDILTVSDDDLLWIAGGSALIGLVLWRYWPALLLLSLHEELARAEAVPVRRLQPLLMVCVSVVVALSIQVVGVLLVTALLIVPAATARFVSRSPEAMACGAMIAGVLSIAGGMALAVVGDVAAGPAMVCAMVLLCCLCAVAGSLLRHTR